MVEFNDTVSLGNLLTIGIMVAGGIKAYTTISTKAVLSVEKIENLTKRINDADLERLKVCVETLWLFQLRRGMAEVEQKQLGKTNSPVRLTDAANKLMAPLLPELKEFYKVVQGEKMGVVELAIALEQQFGQRITTEVCKRVGITDGACLVLAIGQLRPIGPEHLRDALDSCNDAVDLKQKAKDLLDL
jgi:hypothetical protein